VRNLPDGAVEIIAQGSPSEVARMTTWTHRGPRYATVDHVEIETLTGPTEYRGFEIRR
jgi:acylphosphatase